MCDCVYSMPTKFCYFLEFFILNIYIYTYIGYISRPTSTLVHVQSYSPHYIVPGGGGGLTYISSTGMCRGKDPSFLPDPHLHVSLHYIKKQNLVWGKCHNRDEGYLHL